MMYRQCRLSQGSAHVVGWIEERGAKVGASVELPEMGGFWNVDEVYSFAMSAEQLRSKQDRDRNCFASIRV